VIAAMISELIDSHAHLDFPQFDDDREMVIKRARDAGVLEIVCIGLGTTAEEIGRSVRLAASDERLWTTVGVHPHEARLGMECNGDPRAAVPGPVRSAWDQRRASLFRQLFNITLHPKVVAIGETGLDFHYDHSPREMQRELFRAFIRLAVSQRLPLVIHSRSASAEVAAILREEHAERVGGVIHCFDGNALLAETGLALGFYFGLTGVITFRNAAALRTAVKDLPLERLLVETDSPYLAAVPHRGRRNEPAYVVEVARALSEIKGISFSEVARITTDNARRLFGIDRREKADPGRIAYRIGNSLYLNITNRCTLSCSFCLRRCGYELGDVSLALRCEPSAQEVIAATEDALACRPADEVVFCGIGEPLLRLDVVTEVARWLKRRGLCVRVNTDGLANVVYDRDVVAELVGLVDSISVSLNAPDAATYARLCPSSYGEQAFEAVCEFIRRSVALLPEVAATVVDVPGLDVAAAQRRAESLGAQFRLREYFDRR
jgi:TatD DNase family protein